MKIKNIEDLRNHIVNSLEKLEQKKIDIDEASIIAKSGETIMSSLKLEMAYSAMIGNTPYINFIHDCHKGKKIPPKQKLIEDQ